jgi:hypothetical protein
MHPLLPFVIEKMAAEEDRPGPIRRFGQKIKREISDLGSRGIER